MCNMLQFKSESHLSLFSENEDDNSEKEDSDNEVLNNLYPKHICSNLTYFLTLLMKV